MLNEAPTGGTTDALVRRFGQCCAGDVLDRPRAARVWFEWLTSGTRGSEAGRGDGARATSLTFVGQHERIGRYLMRPAFAQVAVEALDNGKVRVHFKTPTRLGQMYTDISRDTFLARLAALVPPPRFNLVRYYGVLASQHKLREKVAPRPRLEDTRERELKLFEVWRSLDAQGVQEFSLATRRGLGPQLWVELHLF